MNRRSWTHDSELSIAVLDEERRRARARRSGRPRRRRAAVRPRPSAASWREHLGATSDDGLVDALEGFDRWRVAAETLDAWHEGGESGDVLPAGSGATLPDRWPPGSVCGPGRSIGRSWIPTAARSASDDPAGSDRRVGSPGGLQVGL